MKKVVSFLFPTYLCLLMVTGCSKPIPSENITKNNHASGDMQILIEGQHTQPIVFQLDDSKAARSLYDQLPITLEVEDYSSDEKIFYPEEKLEIHDAPKAKGPAGTLAYYEPWGNVVMYYGVCNGANGLYALGEVISGADQIAQLSGNIQISKMEKTLKKEEAKKADKPQEDSAEVTNIETKDMDEESEEMSQVNITVGSQSFAASLYDNETVRTFLSQLPMTLPMEDLHGNEKYYYFSNALPTSSQAVSQIYTGDIKLFGNDCLVLFYEDFTSSYSYTSLGQIDDPQGLADALGSGNVSVHFELSK